MADWPRVDQVPELGFAQSDAPSETLPAGDGPIAPIGKEFFRDKVVLDAGCGMGRFTRLAAEFGAREVIGFDISKAVEAARKSSVDIPNLHIIQADICSLPYSIIKSHFDNLRPSMLLALILPSRTTAIFSQLTALAMPFPTSKW